MFFEVADAPAVMRAYDDYIQEAPEQLGAFFAWQTAPPLPFIPEDRHGDVFCAMVTCWSGRPEQGEQMIKPFRDVAEVKAELVGPMPYPALNSAFDALVPKGTRQYWKADFVQDLPDEAIAAHVEHGPRVPTLPSTMHLYSDQRRRRAGGSRGDGVRPPRRAVRDGHRRRSGPTPPTTRPSSAGCVTTTPPSTPTRVREGGYVNFMSADDAERAPENYGATYERLRTVKTTYDPDNLFHLNQNVAPA